MLLGTHTGMYIIYLRIAVLPSCIEEFFHLAVTNWHPATSHQEMEGMGRRSSEGGLSTQRKTTHCKNYSNIVPTRVAM
jgi:hypothetical protein